MVIDIMDYSVRVGIIGYGFMGSTHARLIREKKLAELQAISDIDEKALYKAREENREVKIYTDPLELIRDKNIDAVIIATPPTTHVDLLLKSIDHGKHVLVEKPLATSIRELDKLLEHEIPRDLVVMVGYSLRYHRMYIDLKKFMEKLGRIYFFHHTALGGMPSAGWIRDPSLSGGMLNENAVHILYLFYWYFGEPRRIYATLESKTAPGIDDNILLVSEHGSENNKTTASLLRSWTANQVIRYFEVLGENGSIHVDGYLGGKVRMVIGGETMEYNYETIIDEMYTNELKDFFDSVTSMKQPQVTLKDGVVIQLMVEAAKKSNTTGSPIEMSKITGSSISKLLGRLNNLY